VYAVLALSWWAWLWIGVGGVVLLLVLIGILFYPRDNSF
jgi:hypothetical protein